MQQTSLNIFLPSGVTQGLNQTSKKDLAFKTFVVHNAGELI